jgi:hypothetical protein
MGNCRKADKVSGGFLVRVNLNKAAAVLALIFELWFENQG